MLTYGSENDKHIINSTTTPNNQVNQQHINTNLEYLESQISIDRIKLNLIDHNHKVLHKLLKKFTIVKQTRLLHEFFLAENPSKTKISYIKYPAKKGRVNPWSTMEIHDVSESDQQFLLELLANSKYSLTIIEFALDIFPKNCSWYDLIKLLAQGMVLKNARAGFFNNYKTTLYLGTEAQIHQGPHGVRLYPRPIDKFSYARLELQLNYRGIKKRGLQLPVSPDAVSVFNYLEFRRTNIPKLVELLTKKAKKRYQHKRYRGKIDLYGLCQDTACSYVEHVLDSEFYGDDYHPFDFYYGPKPPVAHQLSNFKREFPKYRHRVEDIFPKWHGRKKEIQELICSGRK